MSHKDRNPELQMLSDNIAMIAFGRTITFALERKICVRCAEKAKEFKDERSKKEYGISGLCQSCQNATFES